MSLMQMLALGGPVLVLLLLLSVATLTLVLLKAWDSHERELRARDFMPRALEAWSRGHRDQALALLDVRTSPLAQLMSAAMALRLRADLSDAHQRELALQLASEQLESARSLLRPLEVIANLAPLLGLLGTVLGMIEVFQQLQVAGDQVNPSVLSGGLWEALLSTAAGLAVALVALTAFHYFDRLTECLRLDMESALTRLFTAPVAAQP